MTTDDLQSPVDRNELLSADSKIRPGTGLDILLSQVADKNQHAFQELYQRTSANLFSVLLRLLKIRSLAENTLQETYIKIWNNALGYRPELGAPLTWMTSIARNQALDLLRKRRTREDLESELFSVVASSPSWSGKLPPYGASQFELNPELYPPLVDSDDAELLSVYLDRLDENQRHCIVKAYCEGFSHEELSAQNDSQTGSVKGWIRRGLMALRESAHELS